MLSEAQIGEIWLLFTDHLDKKYQDELAEKYVEWLVDSGVNDQTLRHSAGIDPILDQAITYYLAEESDDEDELEF